MPSLKKEQKLNKIKKKRSIGSVNLRADVETEKYRDEIKKMEDIELIIFSYCKALKQVLITKPKEREITDALKK